MNISNHNILVWNVRGLNNPSRCTAVRAMVDESNASVVCLSESKLALVDQFTISRILGPRYDAFVYLPAINTRGGIIVA